MVDVKSICGPTDAWVRAHGGDTPEQAQLRACLTNALDELSAPDQIRVGADLINLMRDQLMPLASEVRQTAAAEARLTMKPAEIVEKTGLTRQTIARLLLRSKTS